jgi:lysophospholipase L1-like esterase
MSPGNRVDTPGPTSWLNGETSYRFVRVGGWAVPGSITADMRAGVVPTPADVLVLLGGTNDLIRGIPFAETAANLRAISATVGARTTVLVAIEPLSASPTARGTENARLAALARAQGWHFVDPWTAVAAGNDWRPGTTVDGIHPTPATAVLVGGVIAAKGWQAAALRRPD